MAFYYLETSALVKLYVDEAGTDQLLHLVTAEAGHRFAILALAQAELRSAVRRRERAGDLDGQAVSELLERFALHQQSRFLRQNVSDLVIDLACDLVDRHPLRAYDALQLAGCLVLKSVAPEPPIFTCADHQLLHAAEAEGLAWFNPMP
ncbi:MAG: type II toxin-antitoxin system VapC family toxin [Chloroflexi bacterium]|nr:type II toxin-antitoxin system VapC family toxin [Chloroflexota bacterium]